MDAFDSFDWNLLLDRYRAGECSPAEIARVQAWMQEDPARASAMAWLQQSWEAEPQSPANPAAAYAALHARIAQLPTAPGKARVAPGARRHALRGRTSVWGSVTAAAALVLSAVVFFVIRDTRGQSAHLPVHVATGNGQRAQLTLPDGTHVLLGVASSIQYTQGFGESHRTLQLNGEAFFRVPHQSATPFVIQANGTSTTVLGTSFVVRSYAHDSAGARVAVLDGRISLQSTNAPAAIISAGAIGAVQGNAPPVVIHPGSLAPYTAWITGTLVFTDTPLSQVLQALSRWYDLDIRLADPAFARRPVTATFTESILSPSMLDLFAHSAGLEVRQYGRTITFFPRSQ